MVSDISVVDSFAIHQEHLLPNRIGVVSDTHNNLVNVRDIVALFTAAQVSRMVHAGDITQAKTLDALAGLEMPSA